MVRKIKHPTNISGLLYAVQKEIGGNQAQKKEVCTQLEELLYGKWRITAEQIEECYYPFGQSGYLTVRQKFEIMLYLASKEAHGNGRKQLFVRTGWNAEEKEEIRREDVEKAYLRLLEEEWIQLCEADKKALFTGLVYEPFGYGIVERLLEQETEGVLAGELFWQAYQERGAEENRKEAKVSEAGIGVLEQGRLIRLKFLRFSGKEELCRITKRLVCMGGRGELTVVKPEWNICFADGTMGHAVRPPKSREWGFEIIREKGGIYEADCGIRRV